MALLLTLLLTLPMMMRGAKPEQGKDWVALNEPDAEQATGIGSLKTNEETRML